MKLLIDTIIALVLFAALIWLIILGYNAYNHHKHALHINTKLIEEMKLAMNDSTCATPTEIEIKYNQEISRLQLAQEQLFDANSVSFIFQFVTLILLTIGISVLAIMYTQYRHEQERANTAEKERAEIFSALAPFAAGQNTCVVIAVKYSLIYSLCRLYMETRGDRDRSVIMMTDYQNDILRHLGYIIKQKEGIEPLWHEFILDMADQVIRMLNSIRGASLLADRSAIDNVVALSQECHDILWENGEEFADKYKLYWQRMTGEKPPERLLE